MRPAAALADRLGLRVGDLDLLDQALVHSSWLHEHPEAVRGHNERLEFLGDAVVNLVVSEALFARHPVDDEGTLSARRATIVSTAGLARLAGRIDLGAHLRLGEGESARGGRRRPSLLASSFEAIVGALYLDLGYEPTRDWLVALADEALEAAGVAPSRLKSPKSRLQELTQRRTGMRPDYRIVEAVGPDHEKQFVIEVRVDGVVVGVGEGLSRRVAETAAAAQALETLRAQRTPRAGSARRRSRARAAMTDVAARSDEAARADEAASR
jgi:ribonuclease-3